MKLIFNAPVNSLSFGNVSFNLLREMFKRNMDVSFFPIGNDVNFKAFNVSQEFSKWFSSCFSNRMKSIKKDIPSLKLWHINGSESKLSDDQYLLTFYELNKPTEEEINFINLQKHAFFSSNFSKTVFSLWCKNVSNVPLGFDEDFRIINTKKDKDIIYFGLVGKWEHRKATEKIIKLWAKKYGGNRKYQLVCCVTNPFYKPEQMNQVIGRALEGKKYFNINFLPYLETNTQVNELYNAIDIDLSGLSCAEGWGLPSFNMTALGKWSVVLNATGHKDWATKENSILIESDGQTPAYDGIFFHPNQPFNQGSINTWHEDDVLNAIEIALKKAKTPNLEGIKLQTDFTYSKMLDMILDKINTAHQ